MKFVFAYGELLREWKEEQRVIGSRNLLSVYENTNGSAEGGRVDDHCLGGCANGLPLLGKGPQYFRARKVTVGACNSRDEASCEKGERAEGS